MIRFRQILLCTAVLLAVLQVPLQAQREKLSPADLAIITEKYPEAKKTITGLRYIIHQEGTGPNAESGDMVSVIYKGMLIDGKVFNDFKDRDKPFTFRLGRGNVVEGWDQGLKLMKEGTRMTLIVPYELGYGTRGNPPAVPREATLIFEVEMIKIERGAKPPPPPPEPPKKKKVLGIF